MKRIRVFDTDGNEWVAESKELDLEDQAYLSLISQGAPIKRPEYDWEEYLTRCDLVRYIDQVNPHLGYEIGYIDKDGVFKSYGITLPYEQEKERALFFARSKTTEELMNRISSFGYTEGCIENRGGWQCRTDIEFEKACRKVILERTGEAEDSED